MGKLDSWNMPRAWPGDVISPGDHDALVLADVDYAINLRRTRNLFDELLETISHDPGFKGDIHGSFSWSAPRFEFFDTEFDTE